MPESIVKYAYAAHWHETFRVVVGERAESISEAGSEDDGFFYWTRRRVGCGVLQRYLLASRDESRAWDSVRNATQRSAGRYLRDTSRKVHEWWRHSEPQLPGEEATGFAAGRLRARAGTALVESFDETHRWVSPRHLVFGCMASC